MTVSMDNPFARSQGLVRILCIVVLIIMILAAVYAGWLGFANYSRIRV